MDPTHVPPRAIAEPTRSRRRERGLRRSRVATSPLTPIREGVELDWVTRRERRWRRSLAGLDVVVCSALFTATLGGGPTGPPLWVPTLLMPATVLVLAKLVGLYDRDDLRVHKSTLDETPRLVSVLSQVLLAYVVVRAVLEGSAASIDGVRLVIAWGAVFCALVLGRAATRRLLAAWCGPERCLVVGDVAAADDVRLRTTRIGAVEIVGHEPVEAAVRPGAGIATVVRRLEVDRLILVPPAHTSPEDLHEVVRRSKQSGARVSVLPNTGILTGRSGEVDDLAGTVLLGVRRFRPTRSNRILKRTFDLAVAVPVVVLTAPVIAVLALAVRLDSRGNPIYRQTRVGHHGAPFTLFKLRTMSADAEERRAGLLARNEAGDGLFKLRDDPRITRVGALLRRTHLDELPQLWNVVRGDMSLVGPRPLVVEEDERIGGLDRTRLGLMPGITGPWQILGGAERRVPMEDMLKLDYVYVTDWSLWADVMILLRTAKVVLRRGGL